METLFLGSSSSKVRNLKILHVISSVDPKGGGPIEGVNQLSSVYADHGVAVAICSLDDPAAVWVKNSKVKVIALGPAPALYGYNKHLVPWLKAHAVTFRH